MAYQYLCAISWQIFSFSFLFCIYDLMCIDILLEIIFVDFICIDELVEIIFIKVMYIHKLVEKNFINFMSIHSKFLGNLSRG